MCFFITKSVRYFLWSIGLMLIAFPSFAEKRIALIIGNGHYQYLSQGGRSVIPINDTNLVASQFQQYGFQTIVKTNLNFKAFVKILAELKKTVRPGDVFLFYYVGHTVSMNYETYIPAVDTDFSNKNTLKKRSIKLIKLIEWISTFETKSNVLFFVPFEPYAYVPAFKNFNTDFIVPTVLPNILIAYATQQDKDIATNAGQVYSHYTRNLMDVLQQKPYTEIQDLLKATKNIVKKQSAQTQIPSVYGELDDDLYIIPFEKNAIGQLRALWAWSQKHWLITTVLSIYVLTKCYGLWRRMNRKQIYAHKSRLVPPSPKNNRLRLILIWLKQRFFK